MTQPFTNPALFQQVKIDQRFFDSGKTFIKVSDNQARHVGTMKHFHFARLDNVKI